jgi:hypothetical protein
MTAVSLVTKRGSPRIEPAHPTWSKNFAGPKIVYRSDGPNSFATAFRFARNAKKWVTTLQSDRYLAGSIFSDPKVIFCRTDLIPSQLPSVSCVP